jgi:molybdopterin molybdotransferase
LIPIENAIQIVLAHTPRLPPEQVDFNEAVGRVLAEDVQSDVDLPPFPRSAMDGFALRSEDVAEVPAKLHVIGTIPAGTYPSFDVQSGQAAQIMTGAPVPAGADSVQIVEKSRVHGSEVEILEPVEIGLNIVPCGQEVTRGDTVLKKGTTLDPPAVAVAATVGRTRLRVGRRPSVAVIATGDELVPPTEKPGPAQIRNSNGYSLSAQAAQVGARVSYLGVAADNKASLAELIQEGLTHDVLLMSGGVSMGSLDLVEEVLQEYDVRILIDKIALKPGKPTVFGIAPNSKLVFGLPGNPVSTMVTFELFVRPALAKMAGSDNPQRPYLKATLKGPLKSKGPRRAYLPGWLETNEEGLPWAHPIPTRGSGDIVAFSKANALLVLPESLDALNAGDPIQVYPLDSFLFKENQWRTNEKK